jgi:hypothetical protein
MMALRAVGWIAAPLIVGVEVESKKKKKYEDKLGPKIICSYSSLITTPGSLFVFLMITSKSISIHILL